MFFDGFTLARVPVPGGTIRLRHGGSGPPLLLLHGNPQTHTMWHLVAPALAKRFTVICPDLRGYGFSFKPPATSDHAPYAKTELAMDIMAVMDHFGIRDFFLAGHDRGEGDDQQSDHEQTLAPAVGSSPQSQGQGETSQRSNQSAQRSALAQRHRNPKGARCLVTERTNDEDWNKEQADGGESAQGE